MLFLVQALWPCTHTYESVGAGIHVSMKSAMMAITTLAATKSISAQKLSSRLVFSAVTCDEHSARQITRLTH